MERNIEKPFDLTVIEAKQNIAKAANDSRLPLSILELIFKDLYTQITTQLNASIPELERQHAEAITEAAKDDRPIPKKKEEKESE